MVRAEHDLGEHAVDTVYFGGGTPSILSPAQWRALRASLLDRVTVSPGCEISLECNPESFSEDKARLWLKGGVNRLSIGVQSLDDRELRFLGRPHDAKTALGVLGSPVLEKFGSVGADIIYGLPGQSSESLGRILDEVLAFDAVSHLSAYELTLSPESPLGRHRRLLPLPSEEEVVDMVNLIVGRCAAHGLARYEISNYARPGSECRHNLACWQHRPYVGLGPGAHSYLPPTRCANVKGTGSYVSMIEAGKLPREFEERLGKRETVDEMIMLGLRTVEGVDERRFRDTAGDEFCGGGRETVIADLVARGRMHHSEGRYYLTPQGMLVADACVRALVSV
jgi:oxygen-independent coproporphyrinogen-3 oxidase